MKKRTLKKKPPMGDDGTTSVRQKGVRRHSWEAEEENPHMRKPAKI